MLDYLLYLVSILLLLIWYVWCFLPIIPWPMIAFLGVFALYFTSNNHFSAKFLVIWFVIHIIAIIFDNFIPSLWTKLFKWTKRWVWGSTIWILFAIIWMPFLSVTLGPFWILILPFIWAYIGEIIHTRNPKRAIKSAFGSFFGFLSWTFIKIVLTTIMAFYIIQFLF